MEKIAILAVFFLNHWFSPDFRLPATIRSAISSAGFERV
jgi:hypothetical protein